MNKKWLNKYILDALKEHARGNIALHRANIQVYLDNPAGIGEHSDILEAIQGELDKIAVHRDRLEILKLTKRVEQDD
jgi:hypothetical protein